MATVGFSASEQDKKHIDELAESFIKEHGGNKSSFLAAMVSAYEISLATTELPGRADEIEHVDNLLTDFRSAYIASLSMAKAAKTEAAAAVAAEVERVNSVQSKLQANIDRLTDENKELSAQLKVANDKYKDFEEVCQQLARERETSEIIRGNVRELTVKLSEMQEKAGSADSLVELNKQLKQKVSDLQVKITEMEEEKSKILRDFDEKSKFALERAANERESAVLAVKQEYMTKLDSANEMYNRKIAELLQVVRVDGRNSAQGDADAEGYSMY